MNEKVVLITGAKRGLGKAMAITFAKEGWSIILNDKESPQILADLARELESTYHIKSMVLFGDVSKEEIVKRMLQEMTTAFDHLDVLINNAAMVVDVPIFERSTELFNQTLLNNVTGTYLMSKYFGSFMYQQKQGKIINISSTNGINAFFPTSIDYDASKAAVINMTHNFAIEYAPYILVNSIAPRWMNTEMNADLPEDLIKEETDKIYLKRFAQPEEIANLALFLASEKASYINSAVIQIDGGY